MSSSASAFTPTSPMTANAAKVELPEALDLKAQFREQLSRMPIENAAAFFERLIRHLDRVSSMDAKDRWLAYLGLRAMYAEAKLSRFDRDLVMLRATWKMLEPLLRENGLLLEYTLDTELQEMMERFLTNQPPAPRTRAQQLADKRRRHRLRQAPATVGRPQAQLRATATSSPSTQQCLALE